MKTTPQAAHLANRFSLNAVFPPLLNTPVFGSNLLMDEVPFSTQMMITLTSGKYSGRWFWPESDRLVSRHQWGQLIPLISCWGPSSQPQQHQPAVFQTPQLLLSSGVWLGGVHANTTNTVCICLAQSEQADGCSQEFRPGRQSSKAGNTLLLLDAFSHCGQSLDTTHTHTHTLTLLRIFCACVW